MRKRDSGPKKVILISLSWVLLLVLILACNATPSFQPNSNETSALSPTSSYPREPSKPALTPAYTKSNSLATVTRIIDGDTIEVNFNGANYVVRYIGIDTPETVAPDRPVEPYGLEASVKNAELVLGKTVRLEKDVSETDKYGRLLRYVYVGDLFVNAELVRLGYAQAISYPPDIKYQGLLLQLQKEAIKNGRGLWGMTRF